MGFAQAMEKETQDTTPSANQDYLFMPCDSPHTTLCTSFQGCEQCFLRNFHLQQMLHIQQLKQEKERGDTLFIYVQYLKQQLLIGQTKTNELAKRVENLEKCNNEIYDVLEDEYQ